MPSTYAHFVFGNQLVPMLPETAQELIKSNINLYFIGLHGPDIFFYYKPLCSNSISKVGYALHGVPATVFFENSRTIIQELPNRDAALAYILGFICHFSLDSTCHPYIEKQINSSGLSHTEIEVEYDSMLMRKDGLDPVIHPLTDHIQATPQNAETISRFFPVGSANTLKALRSMIYYNNLLLAPHKAKRLLLSALLRLTGYYSKLHGLIVNQVPNPLCKESNAELDKLYTQALSTAHRLITEYIVQIESDEPLNALYKHTFGAE